MPVRPVSKKQVKIKAALSGATGSGKTMTGLLIARGLATKWEKIGVIDAENGSADLYEHLGPYMVNPLEPPFTTDKYIKAIKECEASGMEVIMIDTISHEWNGQGGILEQVDNVTAASNSKNSFGTGWKTITPKHNEFINAILQSKCHVICIMRSKQEYVIVEENGKKVPRKIGLAPIQREGVEYEFTLHLDLSMSNHCTAIKDRTQLFKDAEPFIATVDTGKAILKWCKTGIDVDAAIKAAIVQMGKCKTRPDLNVLHNSLPLYVTESDEYINAGKAHPVIVKEKEKVKETNDQQATA